MAGIIAAQVTQNQWYEADLPLDEMLQPEFSSIVEDLLESECTEFDIFEEVFDVDEVFTSSYIEGMQAGSYEQWSCFFKENSLIHTPVPYLKSAPTFLITAEQDDLAIAEPVHSDISQLCDLGYEIEHLQCAEAGHVDGALDTLEMQWNWIDRRLQGEALQEVCVVSEPVYCDVEE